MSAKLRGLRGSEVVRALQRAGFEVRRIKGSHHVLQHSDDPTRRAIVPVHAGQPVKPGTLQSILRQTKLTAEEFERLL